MSMSEGSLDLAEIAGDRSFPIHKEIALPITDITLDSSVASGEHDTRHHDDPRTSGYHLSHDAKEEMSHYEQIDIQIDSNTSHSSEGGDLDPKSVYAVKSSDGKPTLALKSREVSTRQCKFEIGEEWETFQTVRKHSVSCPPTPLAGRKYTESLAIDNPAYAASEPGTDVVHDVTDAVHDVTDTGSKTKEPFSFHYLFTTPLNGINEYHIVPNPYNKINHRFHSTLQCPCFLFFFFLCCVPAVHYMQWSDHQFKKGNNDRARKYGKLSTIMFITGSLVGVAFLSVCIYFAADYVRQFVSRS